jgi:hypothetical protein
MNMTEIKAMSTIERIHTMELLWDLLSLEEQEIQSPAWHEQIPKDRQAAVLEGRMKFLTLEQLQAGLDMRRNPTWLEQEIQKRKD